MNILIIVRLILFLQSYAAPDLAGLAHHAFRLPLRLGRPRVRMFPVFEGGVPRWWRGRPPGHWAVLHLVVQGGAGQPQVLERPVRP